MKRYGIVVDAQVKYMHLGQATGGGSQCGQVAQPHETFLIRSGPNDVFPTCGKLNTPDKRRGPLGDRWDCRCTATPNRECSSQLDFPVLDKLAQHLPYLCDYHDHRKVGVEEGMERGMGVGVGQPSTRWGLSQSWVPQIIYRKSIRQIWFGAFAPA